MSPYEADAMCRAIITDRIREADHRRLLREARQSEPRTGPGHGAAPADRRSRVWRLVHLEQAYG